jgi:DNA/RNA-binding domain of Phe-tRNA-synthetase-like protein
MTTRLQVDAHPLLEMGWVEAAFPTVLESVTLSRTASAQMQPGCTAPFSTNDELRKHVRDLLRHGGYKPTGRGKPSSEYLHGVWQSGALPAINAAVDIGNLVSLHTGLPISVVDLDKAREPLSVGIAAEGTSYIFNASGQTIDLGGLLCLRDADGPCANAVKDAQRTKTTPQTRRVLVAVWGTSRLPGRTAQTVQWLSSLLTAHGASVRSSHES